MVLVSADFGELGACHYFVHGLPADVALRVLLPTALADTGAAAVLPQCQTYRSAADVRRELAAFAPQVLLMTTGYLLGMNTGIGLRELAGLLRQARRQRCALITGDPFMGAGPSPWRALRANLRRREARDALLAAFALRGLSWLLRDAWHWYPAPPERLAPRPGLRRIGCCNAAAAAAFAALAAPTSPTEPPMWLFVLSDIDDRQLRGEQGAAAGPVERHLAQRLAECVALGRRARVVGPEALIRGLAAATAGLEGVELHSGMSYPSYLRNLAAAEHAFFWNMLSFSILHRVLAGRPVLFFGQGHMARIHLGFWETGRTLYYGGWQPPVLALGEPFDAAALARHAQATRQAFERMAAAMRALPSPAQVLERVLRESA
jgi:hypothetical protein